MLSERDILTGLVGAVLELGFQVTGKEMLIDFVDEETGDYLRVARSTRVFFAEPQGRSDAPPEDAPTKYSPSLVPSGPQ